MEIKASELRNGLEIDSFFGVIGVNRGRYTLLFNAGKQEYQVFKVMFPNYYSYLDVSTLEYHDKQFKYALRFYNQISGEHDTGIDD